MSTDPNRCADMAGRMARVAKDGTLLVKGTRYTLTFNHATWTYCVRYAANGEVFHNFTDLNTKSLKTARQWLRHYLEN